MFKPASVTTATAYGLGHWLLLTLVQVENTGFTHLHWLPFMQTQNAIAALLVVGLAWVAGRAGWSRWAFLTAYVPLTILVILDPGYFRLFGDHYRLSLAEGAVGLAPSALLSSAAAAVSAAWGVLAVNALLAVVLMRWLRCRKITPAHPIVPVLALGLGFISLPQPVKNAASHPLYPLIHEAFLPAVTSTLSPQTGDDLPVDARASTSPELATAAAKIRAASPKPNLVLIVLESVGTQALVRHLPMLPHLFGLSRSAVLLDHVYAVFPSTALNHLAINTGGHHLTWNAPSEVFRHPFTGPLMARDFAKAGYATALFSSERLDVESMDEFEQHAGWSTLYDFARDVKNHRSENVLSSWSAKEEFTLKQIEPWLDTHRNAPFLLSYMNGATHHPYSAPRDFPGVSGQGNAASYLSALRYTDGIIGQLMAMLKSRGLDGNTIIAITGDHGEAFGEHPGNFTHKNAIYEENVRTFLLISHPSLGTSLRSDRIGSSGDLFATLAALVGVEVTTPGLDLLTRDYPGRAVFFSKNVFPEQWGLRDGRWKFIETIRERQAQLYDLSTDPAERRDLAAAHPELVNRFSGQCERWYLRTDAACTARFDGFTTPSLKPGDVRSYGLKNLTISGNPPTAQTVWIADGKPHDFTLVWQPPSGEPIHTQIKLAPYDYKTSTPCPAKTPGEWTVTVEGSGQIVHFTVPDIP